MTRPPWLDDDDPRVSRAELVRDEPMLQCDEDGLDAAAYNFEPGYGRMLTDGEW